VRSQRTKLGSQDSVRKPRAVPNRSYWHRGLCQFSSRERLYKSKAVPAELQVTDLRGLRSYRKGKRIEPPPPTNAASKAMIASSSTITHTPCFTFSGIGRMNCSITQIARYTIPHRMIKPIKNQRTSIAIAIMTLAFHILPGLIHRLSQQLRLTSPDHLQISCTLFLVLFLFLHAEF